ncbi:YoaK family protein [Novosphingobium sp. BW1]|uniref:YoaK family protein n=1 Tax=Novosphingobium sp. BW1 TaxID=2592621 RepID=UPI0011DE5A04|nr:YoaK family protein [Novosphingobium sp. BW1]TYC91402.1 DUF1275 domain-containing protein [Novosphingobium sp. BW1]
MATPIPASLPRLLLLLSATTGLVDAASVLGLGKVFTANMTGNIVFLGFAAAGTPGFKIAPSLLALVAFMLGAAYGGWIARRHIERPLRRWLLAVAALEAALLCLAALLSLPISPSTAGITSDLMVVIALTGFAMGLRNATVRQLKVADLTTTVLTLTITGIAADRPVPGKRSSLPRRIGAVLAILLGAVLGAALLLHVGLYAPLALAGVLALGATFLFARDPASALPYRT